MRLRIVVFFVVIVAIGAAAFLLVFGPQTERINTTREQAQAEEARASQLALELQRLEALQQDAPKLRARAQTVDTAIPSDPQLAQFILQVQDAATKAGIDWLAVSPSLPAAAAQASLFEINVSMNVAGGYFQVQDFLTRLESLPRAVKISAVSLGAGEGGLPALAASLTMKLFLAAVPAT